MDQPITLTELNSLIDRLGEETYIIPYYQGPTPVPSPWKQEPNKEDDINTVIMKSIGQLGTWYLARGNYNKVAEHLVKTICSTETKTPWGHELSSQDALNILHAPLSTMPLHINDCTKHKIIAIWRLEINK